MALEMKRQADTKAAAAGIFESLRGLNLSGSKVTAKDRMFFTEQLALLLETGSNLHAGLEALGSQVENPAMAEVIRSLSDDIASGKTFSHALNRFPDVFSQTYTNLIGASEEGGFMHQVLEQLLEMEEKRQALLNTIKSALTYPVFLLVFAVAVIVFVLVVVFPKFGDMFASIQDELPMTTIVLMAASDALRQYWAFMVIALVSLVFGLKYWGGTDNGRMVLDRAKLTLPGFREVFTKLYLVQSLRVMSLSLQNGVPILDTLRACREVVPNRVFQNFLAGVETNVEEGGGLAKAFVKSEFIPPIAAQMITTGEESGNLPKVMARLSDYYERDMSLRLETLSKMAEPILLLVMGAVVGIIVSSLILPIFKLSHAAG